MNWAVFAVAAAIEFGTGFVACDGEIPGLLGLLLISEPCHCRACLDALPN